MDNGYNEMEISYESGQLIDDVKEDIFLFGSDFKVYAVYAYREVDKREVEYITSYVDAEKPERDSYMSEKEFDILINDYEKNLASLDKTKNKLMTLSELLELLIQQDIAI